MDAGEAANVPASDVHYGIRMRIRDQGTSGGGTDAGTCSHIAINNTHYDNISHHPYWPGGLFGAADELAVASLGITELAGCAVLDADRRPSPSSSPPRTRTSAASAWCSRARAAPTRSRSTPTRAATPDNQFGTADPDGWTFTSLPPCAYLLKLSVDVLLTTGDGTPSALVDYIAFCKAKPRIWRACCMQLGTGDGPRYGAGTAACMQLRTTGSSPG